MSMLRRVGAVFVALLCVAPAWPVSLRTVVKTPFEAFNYSVDFTPVAGTDGITLIGVVANNVQSGADVTSTIIAASPVPAVVGSTDVVVFRFQNGVLGQAYLIGVRVTDKVTGEIFEGQITLNIG